MKPKQSSDPDRFLEKIGAKWKIRKQMDGITRRFGPYDSVEEARSIRDQLFPRRETGLEFLGRVVDEWRDDPCSECIEWPYSCNKAGYGWVTVKGVSRNAHRVAWEISRSETVPDGLVVRHLPVICHNPSCVNPSHLELGTYGDNQNDMFIDGTISQGEDHYNSKISEETALRVIASLVSGSSLSKVSENLGVSYYIVASIHNKASWLHLTKDVEFPRLQNLGGKHCCGEKSYRATISEDTAMQIIAMLKDGSSQPEISKELGVSRDVVNKIRYKKSWKHLIQEVT